MKKMYLTHILILFCLITLAQTNVCPNDPPPNNFIANSPWPIMHRNTYAQQSTCLRSPQSNDSLLVRFCPTPFNRTSTWLYYTEKYKNGKRAILGSSATHVFKAVDDSVGLRLIDSMRIDFNVLDYSWNHLLLKNRIWISYDYDDTNNKNVMYKYTDVDTNNMYSKIKLLDTLILPSNVLGKVSLLNVTQDGWIAFNTTGGTFGVAKSDFSQVYSINLPLVAGEVSYHNNFPVDVDNTMFVVTTKKMIKLKWNNPNLTIEWTSPYDFVGNGPTATTAKGSGTTPTLIGFGNNDKLVVVCDGHSPNNMVIFWRDNLPANWTALPGKDVRVAGIVNLPGFAYTGNNLQSVENSICANGYDMACAQFNGFNYSCTPVKGVAKCLWDTLANTFSLAWLNTTINMNNALTYSSQSNLVYGNGKASDCNYRFYGLDWNTGNVVIDKILGSTPNFNDQGCNISISDDSTLVEPSEKGFFQIKYFKKPSAISVKEHHLTATKFNIFPNPATRILKIVPDDFTTYHIKLISSEGQVVENKLNCIGKTELAVNQLPEGLYYIQMEVMNTSGDVYSYGKKIIVQKNN
jgi:hypothetical protein